MGVKDFDGKPGREIHDHMFPGANTGLATILGNETLAKRHDYKTVVTSVGTDHLIVIRRVTIGLVKPQTLGPV